jgi:uncharacterized membrane protein
MINVDFFMKILDIISHVISVISVGVVIYGTAIATGKFIWNELRRFKCKNITHQIRVLRAEPGLHELLILGGIVLLRTVLSFFLDREIRLIEMEARRNPEGMNC